MGSGNPQESFLFSDTVGVNIAFGIENPSDEDIRQAAESASVLDNILEFDHGFETLTGERGITLSGGQKQRVSIARALIKQPPIIIFDDSLSAVDTRTESEIIQHLRNRLNHTTVVTISHRISTIQQSDIIYVLDEGSVSEFGTHDDLLGREGIYASMYRKQLIERELEDIH
jgi:ATP-binding cassette subfamily B multidrug efflux pump